LEGSMGRTSLYRDRGDPVDGIKRVLDIRSCIYHVGCTQTRLLAHRVVVVVSLGAGRRSVVAEPGRDCARTVAELAIRAGRQKTCRLLVGHSRHHSAFRDVAVMAAQAHCDTAQLFIPPRERGKCLGEPSRIPKGKSLGVQRAKVLTEKRVLTGVGGVFYHSASGGIAAVTKRANVSIM